MQAKGLIRVFVIVLLLVCLYHLSFSFFTYRIEQRAAEYAEEQVKLPMYAGLSEDSLSNLKPELEVRYLDSVYNTPVLDLLVVSYTYEDLKKSQLGLGLDLNGGMSITLQVRLDELMVAMSDKSKDPAFNAALAEAREKQKTANNDFITLFEEAYEKQPNKKPLASIFATPSNDGKIKYTDSDASVIAVIREEANAAFNKTVEIVRARVDGLGVANPNITAAALTQRIEIELPGIKNPERARKLLQSTAELEFWETLDNLEVAQDFFSANEVVKESLGYGTDSTETITDSTALNADTTTIENVAATTPDTTTIASTGVTDSLNTDDSLVGSLTTPDTGAALGGDTTAMNADEIAQARKDFPLYGSAYSLLIYSIGQDAQGKQGLAGGPVVGYAYGNNRQKVDDYLNKPQVRSTLPKNAKFLWGAKPNANGLYELYAIELQNNTDEARMGGGDVATASRETDPTTGQPHVKMVMTSAGAQKWKKLTTDNKGQNVAIVMDDKVYTAPTVQEIMTYESQITGNFTFREAEDLASIIRSGKLPAPAVIVEEAVVGSTLGAESIKSGLTAMLVAFGLVLAIMLFFYNKAGWITDLALFMNLIFTLGTMASLGATLTMPGIAGLVLSIGMAVDANVIIFERIKEELAKGKTLLTSISEGFSKSYSSIIDANITTLLTGIVLYSFGVGPVRGFALILVIGIISSFVTAVLVSRLIIDRILAGGGNMTFFNTATRTFLTNTNFQFIEKRKIAYVISAIIIGAGIVSFATRGFEMGVDLQGGRSYQIRFDQPVDLNNVRESLNATLTDASTQVKTIGDESKNQLKIVTSYRVTETGADVDSLVDLKVYEALKGFYSKDITYAEFTDPQYKVAASKTGPTIADDIRISSVYATLFSFLIIFLYVLLRFKRREFAIASLICTIHDILLMLSVFTLLKGLLPFSLEIDQNFIAALLTIVGYSINDTVIVFDRMREFLTEHPSKKVADVTNAAINGTLSRTSMTSGTLLLVVLILFIFGGEVIRGFSFALLVGIAFGTYSSVFIAAPLVVDIESFRSKRALKAGNTAAPVATK